MKRSENNPPIGMHVSIEGGIGNAILRGYEAGCDVIQIFTRYRTTWRGEPLKEQEIEEFKENTWKFSIKTVSIHNSYLINLASPKKAVRGRSITTLKKEIEWAETLGIPYVVMHPGSHLGIGEEQGIRMVQDALNQIIDKSQSVRILLETTAGQGTNLGYRFEQLRAIIDGIVHTEKVGICFDTCHVFAGGYDFTKRDAYEMIMNDFDTIIGTRNLFLFHVNDSLHPSGSKKDRHAHIGEGNIGLKPFSFFLTDERFKDVPFILETPKGENENGIDYDIINLGKLREIIKKGGIYDSI